MTLFEIVLTLINVCAVAAAPIIAVWVGQKLSDRSQRRKDKLDIFKTLMMNRRGWSPESIRALNVIDIVFDDNQEVLDRWKDYRQLLCIQNPNPEELKTIRKAQDRMLDAMARSLCYKDGVDWESIQPPYIPREMRDEMHMVSVNTGEFPKQERIQDEQKTEMQKVQKTE